MMKQKMEFGICRKNKITNYYSNKPWLNSDEYLNQNLK